tara:strand:- start:808 stop:1026 length:219 start_codon:yes stop_codon:yes gene_type:complete
MKQIEKLRYKNYCSKSSLHNETLEKYFVSLKNAELEIDLMIQDETLNKKINTILILFHEYEGLSSIDDEPFA